MELLLVLTVSSLMVFSIFGLVSCFIVTLSTIGYESVAFKEIHFAKTSLIASCISLFIALTLIILF